MHDEARAAVNQMVWRLDRWGRQIANVDLSDNSTAGLQAAIGETDGAGALADFEALANFTCTPVLSTGAQLPLA